MSPRRLRCAGRGFSLITAMLMLAVIGLASAAIMRNASVGQQMASNDRLQAQASQSAQFGLRFCQAQLALAPAARAVALQAAASPPAWSQPRAWSPTGGAYALAAADIGGGVPPRVAPQCLLEATGVDGVYTITARGFSADFHADAATGAQRSGAAVWLQETLEAPGDAAAAGLAVRRRVWQQLLTPPF